VTPHSRNDGQDSEGPVKAGSYEVTPSDRLASGECPSRADGSSWGQSQRTSAGLA